MGTLLHGVPAIVLLPINTERVLLETSKPVADVGFGSEVPNPFVDVCRSSSRGTLQST
jgi:hypothetical protein